MQLERRTAINPKSAVNQVKIRKEGKIPPDGSPLLKHTERASPPEEQRLSATTVMLIEFCSRIQTSKVGVKEGRGIFSVVLACHLQCRSCLFAYGLLMDDQRSAGRSTGAWCMVDFNDGDTVASPVDVAYVRRV